jgi:hypothetical protein
MHECSIFDYMAQGQEEVRRHERTAHRDAYFANLKPGVRYYVAPADNLAFCDLCKIYIGSGTSLSHKFNSAHKALVAAADLAKSSKEASSVEQGVLPAAASLDIFMDIPIRPVRRPRLQVVEAPSPLEEDGAADREDRAPDREEDAPSQVHMSHILCLFFICNTV